MSAARRRRAAVEEDESEEDSRLSTQRQRRRAPSDVSSEEEDEEAGEGMDVDGAESQDELVKKIVRHALSCEYQRLSITRNGIREKAIGKQRRPFKQLFDRAQEQLRQKFGMELVELPIRENTTIKGRLKNAAKKSQSTKVSSQYILTTILPIEYRTPEIIPPSIVVSASEEASYIALCTVIVSIIALSTGGSINDRGLMRYLSRLNAEKNMPMDATPAVLKKMEKQGYIVKTIEKTSDDETIEYRVGPRGKAEIGNKGLLGFVKEVYGENAPEDLDKRLQRSLGMELAKIGREEAAEEEPEQNGGPSRTQSGRRRRAAGTEGDSD